VNPGWSRPQFYSLARDDYRTFDLAAGQRFSSPTVDAGAAFIDKVQLLLDYRNLLANPGFESGLAGWTTNPEAGVQTGQPAPCAGTQFFSAGDKAVGWAEQTVRIASAGLSAAQIDSLDYVAVFGGRIRSGNEDLPDSGSIILTFLDGAGKVIGSTTTLYAKNATDRWELVGDRIVVPGNTRSIRFRFEAVRQSDPGNARLSMAIAFSTIQRLASSPPATTPCAATGFTATASACRWTVMPTRTSRTT
jgi:hypothetical protein